MRAGTDRPGVFGQQGAYVEAALALKKIAYGGVDRKFGTWPPSRARSPAYIYYITTWRICQVCGAKKIAQKFINPGDRKIKKNKWDFFPLILDFKKFNLIKIKTKLFHNFHFFFVSFLTEKISNSPFGFIFRIWNNVF